MAASRKTLKRATAEALLSLAQRNIPEERRTVEVMDILAQAEYELHGGVKPAADYDADFLRFWEFVPKERRSGTKYEAQRLWRAHKKLDGWPGTDAVVQAWSDYIYGVRDQHPGETYLQWVKYITLPTTWLNQRRYMG